MDGPEARTPAEGATDSRGPPPLPGRKPSLRRGGGIENLRFPTATAQWARPALPAPAALSGRGGGWRTQAPGGVGAGETIQHTVGGGGGEKPPYRRHGEERNT